VTDRVKLWADLERHEGRVAHAYQDSKGYWTIGVGHCIDERLGAGLPEKIIDDLLKYDVNVAEIDCVQLVPNFLSLPDPVQRGLVEMAFNLGRNGLASFRRMLAAIDARNFNRAAFEVLDSKAAREAEMRYTDIANLIRQGPHV